MTRVKLSQRLIRYEQLMPCKAAFIDAKTPGSHLKDNYSIIGGGVSESKHQNVNFPKNTAFALVQRGNRRARRTRHIRILPPKSL